MFKKIIFKIKFFFAKTQFSFDYTEDKDKTTYVHYKVVDGTMYITKILQNV